jgi:hypothetical protein
MDATLALHLEFDRQSALLGDSRALRRAADGVADHLESGPVTLLARTDAALLVCGAVAMLRDDDTHVLRAYIGRTGWRPPEGAVLVEPVEPAAGLLATLKRVAPGLAVLVLPRLAVGDRRPPIAA